MTTLAEASYGETANTDPYGFYDRVREAGEVVWDEQIGSWLLTSYPVIREVMRHDKKLVRQPSAEMRSAAQVAVVGGERSRFFWNDDRQTRHHRWFVRRFTYTVVDTWRETLMRPILNRLVDDIAPQGRAELWSQFADKFSVRVMAAFMGFPWQDEDWIDHCKLLLRRRQQFSDTASVLGADEETERAALAAVAELNEILLPYILAAKEREPRPDDVMALLWAEGSTIVHDWCLEDMQWWVQTAFFAGTDTTTHAVANAFYLLMTVPGLQDELRSGGFERVERFAEEVLRLYPSVQYTRRRASEDFELRGKQIRKDDLLLFLNACANRDPDRFGCPHDVDLTREDWREHLAFSIGPRTCAGAALARGEVQEAVAIVLARMPNLRLDPDAEQPSFNGFMLRSYRPLHALFTAS